MIVPVALLSAFVFGLVRVVGITNLLHVGGVILVAAALLGGIVWVTGRRERARAEAERARNAEERAALLALSAPPSSVVLLIAVPSTTRGAIAARLGSARSPPADVWSTSVEALLGEGSDATLAALSVVPGPNAATPAAAIDALRARDRDEGGGFRDGARTRSSEREGLVVLAVALLARGAAAVTAFDGVRQLRATADALLPLGSAVDAALVAWIPEREGAAFDASALRTTFPELVTLAG